MYRIKKFCREDIRDLPFRDKAEENLVRAGLTDHILTIYEANPSLTGRDPEGKLISCGGVVILWPGVGEVWCMVTPLVDRYRKGFVETINHLIVGTQETFRLWRVEALVSVTNMRSVKMLHRIGFTIEGIKRKYGPDGVDYLIMARMKTWPQ